MNVIKSPLPDVLVLEPRVFGDDRGFFFESWNDKTFREKTGVAAVFVQDNHSRSAAGVLRGIHYQTPNPQAKLVRCSAGAVWDVAVDLRRSSPSFLQWFGIELSAENKRQLWIPEGFGHGFVAQADGAELLYKATAFYIPEHDRAIAWNDPDLGIDWQIAGNPSLSNKDSDAPFVHQAVIFD